MVMNFTLHHLFSMSNHCLIIEYGPPTEPEEILGPNGEKPPTELSVFFNRIMHDLGVTVTKFNSLLTSYMRRSLRADGSAGSRSCIRGNYKKDFTNPRLSWTNFIKGLDFLTIARVDIAITLEFPGRRSKNTNHRVKLDINSINDMLEYMDESEFLEPPEDTNEEG